MYECYNRKLLRVNLTNREAKAEEIDKQLIEEFIGGMGFGVQILCNEVDAGISPLDSHNKIILSVGPLTGTHAPLFAQTCLVTKSPLTNGILNSYSGGFLGYKIKSSGYDAVVIEGKASKPVYVVVSRNGVEIKECPNLVGRSTEYTEKEIKKNENDAKMSVVSIGAAGEKQVRFAATMSGTRAFGRGGSGAVFGSKNLKAIAFKGGMDVNVWDREKFNKAVSRAYDIFSSTLDNEWSLLGMFSRYGTGSGMGLINEKYSLATKNHRYGNFEKAPEIDGFAYFKKYPSRRVACFSCPVHCGQVHTMESKRYKTLKIRGPEYETMYSFGSNLMVSDLEAVAEAHQICEEYGMDTLSAGCTIAYAMECYEKGLINEKDTGGIKLEYGDGRAMLQFLLKIAERQDIGELFGEGTKIASQQIGKGSEDFAMNVKGMEFAAWMPQRMRGIALTFATSNRGACHKRAPIGAELMGQLDMEAVEGKAQIVKDIQDRVNAVFTLVSCRFAEFELSLESFLDLLHFASGMDISQDKFLKIGEKIWNMERMYNLNSGMDAGDDSLPYRCFEPLKVEDKDLEMSREDFQFMLADYYKVRGWDEQGVPTKAKLESLGVTNGRKY